MKPQRSPFGVIIKCLLLFLLTQTGASLVITMLYADSASLTGMSLAEADAVLLELMFAHQTEILLLSYAVILLVLWFMAKRRKLNIFTFTGLQGSAKPAVLVLALAAGLAAAFWASIAVNRIPWPEALLEEYLTQSGALETALPLVDFLTVVLVGPLVEEMIFRGVIYDALCTFLPAGFAVVFQGMLFGSVHGSMIWILYAALMGCLLGYVRKRTGSLRPCLLMHMAFNGASYLFSAFAERYWEDSATVIFVFLASAFVMLLSLYGISFRTSGEEPKNP